MAVQRITVFLWQDHDRGDPYHQVIVPDYPGCITDGSTVEEVPSHAKDAHEGILKVDADHDMDPSPTNTRYAQDVVTEVDIEVPEKLPK